MTKIQTTKQNPISRPPVVVVLGHIDHGKTTLLSAIRKMKAPTEAGGITQSIGAYEAFQKGKKITFIDTPGHEVFAAMREKGAEAADIALLIVAADEGVRPQTKEALEHIKKAEIPFIVVINKTDKKEAQVEKIKQQLSEIGVFVEGWGGNTPAAEASALQGKGIDELLDLINLLAEIEEIKGDPEADAKGFVIDSRLDSKKGISATLIIKEGTVKTDDFIAAGSTYGKIKLIENFEGKEISQALMSQPVRVFGLNEIPLPGSAFLKVNSRKEAQIKAGEFAQLETKKEAVAAPAPDETKKTMHLVVKAGTLAQAEAATLAFQKIQGEEFFVEVIKKGAGEVNENDIKTAQAASAAVIGFGVKVSPSIADFAQRQNVKIISSPVIYELIDQIRKEIALILGPRVVRSELGMLKILATFGKKEENQYIVGGEIFKGKVKKSAKFDVERNKKKIGEGETLELQKEKLQVAEAGEGAQCGILYKGNIEVKVGDILRFFEEIKQPAL